MRGSHGRDGAASILIFAMTANVGRYDMHIFCRYTSTYICFFNLYEHIINRFIGHDRACAACQQNIGDIVYCNVICDVVYERGCFSDIVKTSA